MENIETLTLAEIVRRDYKAAAIFEKFSLDFCCNGNQKIRDACKAANIDPSVLVEEMEKLAVAGDDEKHFDSWPLHQLVDHIFKTHHAYIEEKSPQIKRYLDKICQVHGKAHPELYEVRDIFFGVAGELAVHMKKEEIMLFPFIRKLERAKNSGEVVSSPLFRSVNFPVDMMKEDHSAEGEKFKRIAALTGNYTTPADGCNTYSVAYDLLNEFERDLHMHIHLENNILFPKAIRLEEELNAARSGAAETGTGLEGEARIKGDKRRH